MIRYCNIKLLGQGKFSIKKILKLRVAKMDVNPPVRDCCLHEASPDCWGCHTVGKQKAC